jgi:hypothetical protein
MEKEEEALEPGTAWVRSHTCVSSRTHDGPNSASCSIVIAQGETNRVVFFLKKECALASAVRTKVNDGGDTVTASLVFV